VWGGLAFRRRPLPVLLLPAGRLDLESGSQEAWAGQMTGRILLSVCDP
jgi:hypothetical protein